MSELIEIRMPRYDPAMESGKIIKWFKKEGDKVAKGEPLVLIETEKVAVEYPSPYDGIIEKILFEKGEVKVGQTIAYINPNISSEKANMQKDVLATPSARRIAREFNVDLKNIQGTGPHGRITAEDVQRYIETIKQSPIKSSNDSVDYELLELSQFRATIAEKMVKSSTNIPQVPLFFEVYFDEMIKLAKSYEQKGTPISLSSIIIKATSFAIRKHPLINSSFENNKIKIFKSINIGYALNTKEGLIVVVIKNTDKKNILEINNELELLKKKAESNSLEPQDVLGSTFTITNLGPYEVNYFIPLINYPQAAILAIGKIEDKFQIENKSIRKTCMLTLVFDHRIMDGAQAALFAKELKNYIENPFLLFI